MPGMTSREPPAHPRCTRLAPSPTGALHPGNARTFLVNWALARRAGWRIVMRIEDLDSPRVRPGRIAETLDTLAWLGLDWDGGVMIQSADLEPYRAAMDCLARAGKVYPSDLSRKDLEAVSAPQEGSNEVRFDASLRPADRPGSFDDRTGVPWRFVVEPGAGIVLDAFAGACGVDVEQSVGDFVVWTRAGVPAYQLAVVVDDARQGVTDIVRGNDLLESAARQMLLIEALGLGEPPRYFHLPLVRGPDGRRLAKRHGDSRLSTYRDAGTPPERIVGLCAHWCGILGRPEPMSAADFADGLDLSTMSRDDVVFTPEDDRWLREG